MNYFLDEDKSDLIALDGLPRDVRGHDETGAASQHVQYESGGAITSMLAADWIAQYGALPTPPTQAESAAASHVRRQAATQAQAAAAALRQRVLTELQSAAGISVGALNTAQLKALVAALAWKVGALNPDTTVKPPADWLR